MSQSLQGLQAVGRQVGGESELFDSDDEHGGDLLAVLRELWQGEGRHNDGSGEGDRKDVKLLLDYWNAAANR